MVLNVASRAWNYCRRYGLVKLLFAASAEKHRIVPFRYRIALRSRINEYRHGPGAVTEPLKVYRVGPDQIQYNGPTFGHDKCIGTVRGGDWDLNRSAIADEEMYVGLRERFVDGADWEDTQYYELAKREFESDGGWLGYTSFESFEEHRLSYLDRLYRDVEEHGYKSQRELDRAAADQRRHGSVPAYHAKINEVTCNVGRDGTLLLNNGIHRLSIAKLLDLDSVPIQLVVRHDEWQTTRSVVATSDDPSETAREDGVEPTHPDLVDVTSTTDDASDRRPAPVVCRVE